jgi:hypothetical protein
MSLLETLPFLMSQFVGTAIHAGVFIIGLMLLKQASGWGVVAAIAVGVALLNSALTMVSYLLQGWERASQMILPSGDMFAFVTLPMAIGTVIFTLMTMFAAYGLFVEPGKKHV